MHEIKNKQTEKQLCTQNHNPAEHTHEHTLICCYWNMYSYLLFLHHRFLQCSFMYECCRMVVAVCMWLFFVHLRHCLEFRYTTCIMTINSDSDSKYRQVIQTSILYKQRIHEGFYLFILIPTYSWRSKSSFAMFPMSFVNLCSYLDSARQWNKLYCFSKNKLLEKWRNCAGCSLT